MDNEITLSKVEIEIARLIGTYRSNESLKEGLLNRRESGLAFDIQNIAAKIVYAKYRDLYFDPSIDNFHGPDFKSNVKIRHTVYDTGKLIIRPQDDLNYYYVLITGKLPTFKIRGFIYGADAVRSEWHQDPQNKEGIKGECWMVSQEALIYIPPNKKK
jgi:hypothetical protein